MYCGWIKMPLGMEVGRGPVDIALDEDLAHQQYRTYLPA